MRVWFYPVDEPDVYVIVRPDPATTIVCLSDGLTVARVAEAAGHLATVEEREWVRAHLGYAPVAEDPTYSVLDEHTKGEPLWHRSMIPNDMLWTGKVPRGELSQTAEREVASDRPSS